MPEITFNGEAYEFTSAEARQMKLYEEMAENGDEDVEFTLPVSKDVVGFAVEFLKHTIRRPESVKLLGESFAERLRYYPPQPETLPSASDVVTEFFNGDAYLRDNASALLCLLNSGNSKPLQEMEHFARFMGFEPLQDFVATAIAAPVLRKSSAEIAKAFNVQPVSAEEAMELGTKYRAMFLRDLPRLPG